MLDDKKKKIKLEMEKDLVGVKDKVISELKQQN
jgi:hypothetical protein